MVTGIFASTAKAHRSLSDIFAFLRVALMRETDQKMTHLTEQYIEPAAAMSRKH